MLLDPTDLLAKKLKRPELKTVFLDVQIAVQGMLRRLKKGLRLLARLLQQMTPIPLIKLIKIAASFLEDLHDPKGKSEEHRFSSRIIFS